jgi:hypothetical protein
MQHVKEQLYLWAEVYRLKTTFISSVTWACERALRRPLYLILILQMAFINNTIFCQETKIGKKNAICILPQQYLNTLLFLFCFLFFVNFFSRSYHTNTNIKGTVSRDGFGFWWHVWLVLGLNRGWGHFLNFLDFSTQKVYFLRLMRVFVGLVMLAACT